MGGVSGKGSAPGADGRRLAGSVVVLRFADVPGLRPLRAIDDLELDRLTLLQGPEAAATDGRVVDEHVASTLALDEPVALGVIEPLDLACNTHRSSSLTCSGLELRDTKKDRECLRGLDYNADSATPDAGPY